MPETLPPPLGGPPPSEVPLARSPLVRVVMQVQFSTVLKIDGRDGIVDFQEGIRSLYPLFEQTASQQLQLDLSSPTPSFRPVVNNVWQFSDAERSVRLSLGPESATLEALRYSGRTEFMERWIDILQRIETHFAPTLTVRVGTRYLNQIENDSLAKLTDLIRPNFIGVAQPELREHVTQALSQASMKAQEGDVALRWGVLAPNMTIDPGLLPPLSEPSWLLDIDVSSAAQKSFGAARLGDEFYGLAGRAYSLFRYAITDAALDFFGATR